MGPVAGPTDEDSFLMNGVETPAGAAFDRRPLTLALFVERIVTRPWWLPICAALGTIVRWALVAKVGGAMAFYDEGDYDRIGQALAHGQGFVNNGTITAFHPPGEPFFLAAVYVVFGHRIVLAEALQALMLAVVPFAVARFGRRHGLGQAWANGAGAIAAFHPGLAYASATLYPAALTATSLTLGLMWSGEAIAAGKARLQSLLGGLFLGIAGAATTTFVPLGALAAAIVFKARTTNAWRTALVLAAAALVPAFAWIARNEVAIGAPVIATNGSCNLALGASDQSTPRSGNWVELTLPPTVGPTEIERDHAFRSLALDWIRVHPARYAMLVGGRALATFDSVGKPKTRGVHDSLAAKAVGYLMFPWIFLSVVGLVLDCKKPTTWLVVAAIGCVVLSSALTITKPRFRFPCDPMLAVFAMVACRRAWIARSSPVRSSAEVA
jgi:hypothetical protein